MWTRQVFFIACACAAMTFAQPQPPRPQGPPPGPALNEPGMMERLGLNPDQRKRVEAIRQDHRLKQIDLRANLEKARITLEPLIGAEQPEENKILQQMDRLSQAENELRKDEMRQQLEIRKVLTPDQWRRVQDERRNPAPQRQPGPGGRQGKGRGQGPQGPPPQN